MNTEARVDITNGVAVLTLDAPGRRNALTTEMAQTIVALCDEIESNRRIGAVVITGSGGNFCAGAHRDVLAEASVDPAASSSYESIGQIYAAFRRVGGMNVPTIAAVEGAVVGAGVNLMLAADLRIVGEAARIQAGFMDVGIHPGGGHFHLLHRSAGRETTAAVALFGQVVSGPEAKELGLAWDCVPDGQALTRALAVADRAARDADLARAMTMAFRTACDAPGTTWDGAIQGERAAQMWSLRRLATRSSA